MSSPVVESARTIPLIIERGGSRQSNNIPMEIDTSGFPFERDTNRDGHLRSQLDDIAKRHPEFAEHLGNFSRRRQSSGEDSDDFHRRFERPFGRHLDRFGFPFDRDNFDPEQYAQQFYQQQPEFHHAQPHAYQHQHSQPQPQSYQQQPGYQQQYQQQPEQPQQCPQPQNAEPAPECCRGNIQQSNTADLGQRQEPVNDRNQRSMSAPPADKGQRFTSSVNIPVNQPSEGDNMAQTQSDGKTTERIIPIHIEGRDEPVLPKTAPPTYNAPPQAEKIFGQRPEHFTQFVNRDPKFHHPGYEQTYQGFDPDEVIRQQRFAQPPYYQQQRPTAQQQQHAPPRPQTKEEIPIPVQREAPPTKQQAPQQQQAAPPQSPQPKPAPQQQKPKTPIDQIQAIQKDVSELMAQVENFKGKPRDKQYLYLDEMLTRNLLKLDNIDTQGQDSIRSARKEAIKCIEKAISVLEAKASGNVEAAKDGDKMEVEEKPQEQPKESGEGEKQSEVQTMETEPAATEPEVSQPQPMELSPESVPVQESAAVEEKPTVEDAPQPEAQVVENRAVLVTNEDKNESKTEDKTEPMEVKEETPAVPEASAEASKPETCEGQKSNLPVAEAVKKFEAKENEKEENKSEDKKGESQSQDEKKAEEKKEEKKEKKKGKKKAEKKEK